MRYAIFGRGKDCSSISEEASVFLLNAMLAAHPAATAAGLAKCLKRKYMIG